MLLEHAVAMSARMCSMCFTCKLYIEMPVVCDKSASNINTNHSTDHTTLITMLMITLINSVFGELREVHIIRNPDGTNKGCAFIKYIDR
jgi:hypothetical protein